ncbi:DegT/DnrJ/EryC1/StrS family aminotransferase [Falsiroseomonas oryzae]|uniref:DegT/DnrJ/EryC1/StrS family aminotransferase n=1 Tax=Falsiroseomonas oryzae TaxID=2766473 RepID=UPI0022EADA98|nr:DegT/DnrJ/EryC1/StrS family aminotransferase [Roseomonas sp. MO-31]
MDGLAGTALIPRREPVAMPRAIPVARPWLPDAGALLPYLRRIDAARIYANWGPLNAELERRLAERLGAAVVTVSTATDGLACALRAVLEDRPAAQRRGLCLMPSWTFVATAHAAVAAGLTPCFLDVDEACWTLTPDRVRAALRGGLARRTELPVSAIVTVAPFGLPLDPAPWDELAAGTGIPVVIDAAAAFDGLRVGMAPAVVSMHATKTVCAGEGGFVATRDADLARRVKRTANFGFFGARIAEVAGLNAKLSEYHAAVGLASLDQWPTRRGDYMAAGIALRAGLEPLGCGFLPGFGEAWVSSSCVLRLPPGRRAAEVAVALGLDGVGTRAWWGAGCHASPAFAPCPVAEELRTTARLAETTLGLPFFPDLQAPDVARIVTAMDSALGGPKRRRRPAA